MTLGLVLLAAAIFVVVRQQSSIRAALEHIADQQTGQRARLIAIMLGSVVGNIMLTGVMFRLLMSRYGPPERRVGGMEMQAVIAGATLINYLPLRPGIVGRVAYHRTVNGVAIGDSIKTVVQAAVISAVVAGVLTVMVLLVRNGVVESWRLVSLCAAICAFMSILARGAVRTLFLAGFVRFVDVLVTALRYHAAFALMGSPVDPTGAIAFACISVLATMVPLVSNGLGLREWAIGLLAPAIASYQLELGLTADLLNRAAELVMVTAAGVPATLWLAKRVRASAAASSATAVSSGG